MGLWADVITAEIRLHSHRKRKANPESQHVGDICRACQVMGEGQYKQAMQLLSPSGLTEPSEKIRSELLANHPQVTSSDLPPSNVPPPAKFKKPMVLKALRSFPAGTTPSPSCL